MFNEKRTIFPEKMDLCDKCKDIPIAPWLYEEMGKYAYSVCRNDLIMVAKRDLCPECADKSIKLFDEANGFTG